MEHKVITIKNEQYYVVPDTDSRKSTCSQCCFYDPTQPHPTYACRFRILSTATPCTEFDINSDDSHFFVPVDPKKSLVEESNQSAGINPVKTFTKEQIAAAYHDWNGEDGDEFANYVEKFNDSEYQEFLRLKEKFNA